MIVEALLSDYIVVSTSSLKSARETLEAGSVSLLILDIEMPDGDGLEFFSLLRSDPRFKALPVVFLSSTSSVARKVTAFSLGAADFVSKPFDGAELRARVEARMRHAEDEARDTETFQVADLVLNSSQQKVWIHGENGRETVSLTPTEFRLLATLVKNLERIYDRDTLISQVWGRDTHVLERTVDTHVSHIRKKISASSIHLDAVAGEGYRALKKAA